MIPRAGPGSSARGCKKALVVIACAIAPLTFAATSGAAQGTLEASPKQLRFGNQAVNTQASLTVTVTNTGSQTVNIIAASITRRGFACCFTPTPYRFGPLTPDDCFGSMPVLAPGASCSVAVEFAPTEPGNFQGILRIHFQIAGADAPDSPLEVITFGHARSP